MKRHRFLGLSIDATRNLFTGDLPAALVEKYRDEQRDFISKKYGSLNFEAKFNRWVSVPKPVLSVVDEHTHLLQDIEDTYVCGNLYSVLTGACCLGERIFNQIILRTKESYRSSPKYKLVHSKDSINDWEFAIDILVSWGIVDAPTAMKYHRLKDLRNESVHFQNKEQDLILMATEAIKLINGIVSGLFELNREKEFLIWFEVPGEIYLKKEAEEIPFIRSFYVPGAPLVGYKHTVDTTPEGSFKAVDNETYSDDEISDSEFVRLRKEFTAK